MDVRDMAHRARMLAANADADERVKAAVNALAGAVERQEERLFLLEERAAREDSLLKALRSPEGASGLRSTQGPAA